MSEGKSAESEPQRLGWGTEEARGLGYRKKV